MLSLECGHRKLGKQSGDIVWCPLCQAMRKVITEGWYFEARKPGTKDFVRYFGKNKLLCRVEAAKFALRHPGRTVVVKKEGEPDEPIRVDSQMRLGEYDVDSLPPF